MALRLSEGLGFKRRRVNGELKLRFPIKATFTWGVDKALSNAIKVEAAPFNMEMFVLVPVELERPSGIFVFASDVLSKF